MIVMRIVTKVELRSYMLLIKPTVVLQKIYCLQIPKVGLSQITSLTTSQDATVLASLLIMNLQFQISNHQTQRHLATLHLH
uniref:Putative secreted protein n=1 Tax=Panstrongylus lignarius TaxID=156445 RepID=A0A224XSS3_9HEMI